jgi:uncharacterized protein YyaL (SSP411 family)
MNRLAGATSPYLRQHAHNPVDWFPWSDEAFERARDRDVPVFLSIGYAACHWCHVMERESFEDEETARSLNDHFVAIKVDREERPDIDAVYMDAVQAMTGSGGWPMSVFLSPDGRPFYAATYLPDTPRYGMPSFGQVLEGIRDAWQSRRDEVLTQGDQITKIIERATRSVAAPSAWTDRDDAATAQAALTEAFDPRWGGFGGAPKFPQPTVIEWLLRRAARGDHGALSMATRTLDGMARGGIHDQVGGGFCRYSTDAAWHVPHFEKMLYDNAQLLQVYTRAWLLTRNPAFHATADRTAGFLLGSMRSTDGGFTSSLDADTEGVEGRYYTWSWEELVATVGESVASIFGASPAGDWEGTNVLWLPEGPNDTAVAPGGPAVDLEAARELLREARDQRSHPKVDDKVVVAWNGLTIRALSVAGRALDRPDLVEAAVACARFIDEHLRDAGGGLFRSFGADRAEVPGFCDDYALLGLGLLALFEATGDPQWFSSARGLADTALKRFADPTGGFFMSASDAGTPLVRPKDLVDAPLPSGNAAMCELLVRLSLLTGEGAYRDTAENTAASLAEHARRQPAAFGHALSALDMLAGPTSEVAIVGEPGPDRDAMWAEVTQARYLPNAVLAVGTPSGAGPDAPVPLLRDRPMIGGHPTAYVCERFVCRTPVTDPKELAASL